MSGVDIGVSEILKLRRKKVMRCQILKIQRGDPLCKNGRIFFSSNCWKYSSFDISRWAEHEYWRNFGFWPSPSDMYNGDAPPGGMKEGTSECESEGPGTGAKRRSARANTWRCPLCNYRRRKSSGFLEQLKPSTLLNSQYFSDILTQLDQGSRLSPILPEKNFKKNFESKGPPYGLVHFQMAITWPKVAAQKKFFHIRAQLIEFYRIS